MPGSAAYSGHCSEARPEEVRSASSWVPATPAQYTKGTIPTELHSARATGFGMIAPMGQIRSEAQVDF